MNEKSHLIKSHNKIRYIIEPYSCFFLEALNSCESLDPLSIRPNPHKSSQALASSTYTTLSLVSVKNNNKNFPNNFDIRT